MAGAQPQSLSKPVPGESQGDAFDKYLTQFKAPKQAAAPSPQPGQGSGSGDEFDQFLSQQPQPAPPSHDPYEDMASDIGNVASRTLDYAGGLVRTGVAGAAGAVQAGMSAAQGGQLQSPITTDDVKSALKGEAPNAAEYMRRLGVPEGFSMQIPGLGKVTARGAAGLATDVMTSPLGELASMAKEAPYIGKVLNAPGTASEALGEAYYRSALSGIDAKLAERGKGPVSSLLMQEGASGSMKTLVEKVDSMSQVMDKLRDGLYEQADQAGVQIKPADIDFSRTNAVLEKMNGINELAPTSSAMKTMISQLSQAQPASVAAMSDLKTELYNRLPQTAFTTGKVRGMEQQLKAALASDVRQCIIDESNKAAPGLGDSIDAVNQKWGTLLSATRPMKNQAAREANKKLVDWIDFAFMGSGHFGAEAAKKAGQLATTTYAKTVGGQALMKAGQNGLATNLTFQATRNNSPQPPPALQPNPGEEQAGQ